MIKGLYTSASGMVPQIKKQEITANNVANAGTPGFKKDLLFTKELSKAELKHKHVKSDWQKPMIDQVYTDYAPGAFDKTGNPLNLAIDGDGFFRLQLPDGSTGLTRSGAFEVDAQGFLATADGSLVLGDGGPITIGSGQLSVAESGEVEVDGISAGKITPVTVDDVLALEKIGNSTFLVPDDVPTNQVEFASIRQGYLEESNVDIVREMVDMMIAYRTYEANAKAVQTQDKSLDNLFSRVAGKG